MNTRNALAAMFVAAALTTAGGSAAAETRPDDLKVVEAKQRMVEGKRFYSERKYEEAWLKFVQACAVLQSEKCITGLAVTEYAAGKLVDSYNHLRDLLEPTPKPSLTAPQIQDLTRTMNEAFAKTSHLKIDAPQGAVILVDNGQVGIAPLRDTVTVTPGSHRVEAKLPEHTLSATSDAVAAQVMNVSLVEAESPGVPAPAITSAPAPIEVPRDAPTTTRSSWISSPVVPIALGVVCAGLVVGGAISLSNANSDDNHATQLRSQSGITRTSCANPSSSSCAELASVIDSRDANRSREAGFFVGAGVAAAGLAAWFVWGREGSSHTAVIPALGPGYAGGSLTTRF